MPRNDKKRLFVTLCLTPNCYATPSTISMNLIPLKVDSVGYIFAADSMRLSCFKFSRRTPKDARSTSRSLY